MKYDKRIVDAWEKELGLFLRLMGESDEDNPELGTKPYQIYVEKIHLENFKRLSKDLLDYVLKPKDIEGEEEELAIPEELKEKKEKQPTGRIFFEDADQKLQDRYWKKARQYYKKGFKNKNAIKEFKKSFKSKNKAFKTFERSFKSLESHRF